ncbi:MAG: acetyltransferase [Alphaproteobacteria bacterium]|nr:acetyltransferase [Alphaproteobacteria bacterium]
MNEQQVKKWWDEGKTWTLEDIQRKYDTYVKGYKLLGNLKAPIHGFVINADNKQIGYIQHYDAYDFRREQEYLLENLSPSLASIDLYIGNPDFVGKGLGPKIIERFLVAYIWPNFEECLVDPNLSNTAAIKAFLRAGFTEIKEIEVTNTLLMLKRKD